MDMNLIIITAVVSIISSIITSYFTSKITVNQENVKWKRELAQRIAELKASAPNQAQELINQFSVGYLRVIESSDQKVIGEKFFIPIAGTIKIGRGPENDVVINDMTLSRTSLVIKVGEDKRVQIFTLGSANVLLVNDKRVDFAELQEGDSISIGQGKTTLKYYSF